jgi:hypothetical protein
MGAMRMHHSVCHHASITEVESPSIRGTFSLVLKHEPALQNLEFHARASFAQRMACEQCMLFRGTGAASAPSEQAVSRQS